MRDFYFILVFVFFSAFANAQVINIPDANFKAKLLESSPDNPCAFNSLGEGIVVDVNSNGQIELSEALTVRKLQIYNANVNSLAGIQSFSNLTELDCTGNNLTSIGMTSSSNLQKLTCSENQISILNLSGFPNLIGLVANHNQIPSISLTGLSHLEYIFLYYNQLTTINLAPCPLLNFVGLSYNNIPTLNLSVCPLLEFIYADHCTLSNINITGCSALVYVYVSDNNLTSLVIPPSAVNLQIIDCGNNQIQSLPLTELGSLQYLMCEQNQIASLDLSGHVNLQVLDCSFNGMTSLSLAECLNLFNVNASNNELVSFDMTGNFTNMSTIDFSHNLITEVDMTNFNAGFITAIFDDNLLQSINLRNGRFDGISFINNPTLEWLCCDPLEEEGARSIALSLGLPNCVVSSYCSFEPFTDHFENNATYSFDTANNGCDVNDLLFLDVKLRVTRETVIVPEYFVNAPFANVFFGGNFTISPDLEIPSYFNVSPQNAVYNYPASNTFSQSFCIAPNGSHSDIEVAILPIDPANPGLNAKYKIVFRNKGTTSMSGTVTFAFDDNLVDFISSTPITASQTGNLLTWNYIDLQPFESREVAILLNINSASEIPPVNPGTFLNYTASISPSDEMPIDNNFVYKHVVTVPGPTNDKICISGTSILTSTAGGFVYYIIRFENTGTDIVQNVAIRDIIDNSKFDINSLIPISASHPYFMRITETNKTEFIFENIDLPFDDATNDGYVAFKIKTQPWLGVGTIFSNTAEIYFSYSERVITNTAETQFQNPLSTHDFKFSDYFILYPNPSKNLLNFKTKNGIELKSIEIYNVIGQLVISIPNAQNVSAIDVSDLVPGNYFIKINSDKGTTNAKFVKN